MDLDNTRDPLAPVQTQDIHNVGQRKVVIRHPGYKDEHTNILFSLPSTDYAAGRFGVHYGTVYAACYIIAANCHGWLSRLGDASESPIALDYDEFLETGDYYYHTKCLRSAWPIEST